VVEIWGVDPEIEVYNTQRHEDLKAFTWSRGLWTKCLRWFIITTQNWIDREKPDAWSACKKTENIYN
jgi:hypothetical protein